MRRVVLALGILAGLILVILVAAWLFIDPNKYHGLIQAQLEQQLGRKVTLGKMSLGLIPPRLQVENPVIAEDSAFGQQRPFIRAEKLDVRVGVLSFLTGGMTIHSLELERPSVELIKSKPGRWNFSTFGRRTEEIPAGPSEKPGRTITLNRLTIHDGQVAVTDLQTAEPRTVYDHIDLTLNNYTKGEPFSFELAAHIQGAGAQEVHLKGEGGPVPEENPANTPFKANLSVKEVGIEGLKKFLNNETVSKASGSLSGESQIENQNGALTAVGNLKLDGAKLNGRDLGYPISVDFSLASKAGDKLITIKNAKVLLGETPLSATGTVSTSTTPPSLNLNITSGDVSIAEITRLLSSLGIAVAPGTDVAGRFNANIQARGSAAKPALTGTVDARDLKFSGKDIPQPVEVKNLHLTLSPTEIQSNEFNATSGKTAMTGRFTVLQYLSKTPAIDAVLRAPNATLPEIQTIARAYGINGLDRLSGSGALNLDLHAGGPLESLSSAGFLRALNGNLALNFKPVRISGFDAAHELAMIGGFGSGGGDQGSTDIELLTGHILVKNGMAQTNDLKVQLGMGNVAAIGTADLVAETLNLKLSAVLTKAFSDKVGGKNVAGYLNTALANSAGELVIPAIVTGTFSHPKFSPDVAALAQMQRQRLLPTFDNPAGALSGVLGSVTGKKDKTQEQTPAQKPAENLKGVFDGIFGGKKKPDQH
jgi:uncharacterized protein involved in outer membrane biogenesis